MHGVYPVQYSCLYKKFRFFIALLRWTANVESHGQPSGVAMTTKCATNYWLVSTAKQKMFDLANCIRNCIQLNTYFTVSVAVLCVLCFHSQVQNAHSPSENWQHKAKLCRLKDESFA